jgi:hypothetical protein
MTDVAAGSHGPRNPWLSREQVHAWSEAMGEDPAPHQAAIQRLLRDQRRLSRFVEENAKSLTGVTGGVAVYLIGVVLRMFELAGGRLRTVTWDDVRAAERRVGARAAELVPVDGTFVERARAMDRRQPHVLDEALYALFERDTKDGEAAMDPEECAKVYFLLWVAVEALDANWTAPRTVS